MKVVVSFKSKADADSVVEALPANIEMVSLTPTFGGYLLTLDLPRGPQLHLTHDDPGEAAMNLVLNLAMLHGGLIISSTPVE